MASSRKEFLHIAVLPAASPSLVPFAEPGLSRGNLVSPLTAVFYTPLRALPATMVLSPAAGSRRAIQSDDAGDRAPLHASAVSMRRAFRVQLGGRVGSIERTWLDSIERTWLDSIERTWLDSIGRFESHAMRCTHHSTSRSVPIMLKSSHLNFTSDHPSL